MTDTSKKIPYFDKQTTNVLKGIALLLMFVHHFFTFPTWWLNGIEYPFIERVAPIFCDATKICVHIFCFITGYFYYFNKNKTFKYSLKKISDVLISYWVVFILFGAIAFFFAHYSFVFMGVIKEILALYRPTMYFCWYVSFYVVAMLLMPILYRVMSKNAIIDILLMIYVVPFLILQCVLHCNKESLVGLLWDMYYWLPILLLGYICANYQVFEKLEYLNKKLIKSPVLNTVIWLLLAMCLPLGRRFFPSFDIPILGYTFPMDFIYPPIYLYLLINLCKSIDFKWTKTILGQIGKYSLLMWFISCIFFNNSAEIFQPLLYLPKNPVLVLIWGTLLCYIPSYFLDKGITKLQNYKNKLFF